MDITRGTTIFPAAAGVVRPNLTMKNGQRGRELLVFPMRQNSLRYFGGTGETHERRTF